MQQADLVFDGTPSARVAPRVELSAEQLAELRSEQGALLSSPSPSRRRAQSTQARQEPEYWYHELRPSSFGPSSGATVASRLTEAGDAEPVDSTPPTDTPRLNSAHVVRAIRARQNSFRSCYERSLRDDPQLVGRVTIGFTVNVEGHLIEGRATSNTTGSARLAQCVVEVIESIRLPIRAPGRVNFSYPFIFAPRSGERQRREMEADEQRTPGTSNKAANADP
ncbi:MAG: AgmX/PglI C-terminal domain-containing protein [Myxococcota bacterium]